MVRNYYCPRLEISSETYFNNFEDIIGQIKYDLDYDKLRDELFKNEECVNFFKEHPILSYFPLPKYYSDDIKKIFDLYGGEITKILNGKNFKIKLYFYSVKNPELITKDTILKHRIIFEQCKLFYFPTPTVTSTTDYKNTAEMPMRFGMRATLGRKRS